jgi:hypothetical protein
VLQELDIDWQPPVDQEGILCPWRWRHCVSSKCQKLVTHWQCHSPDYLNPQGKYLLPVFKCTCLWLYFALVVIACMDTPIQRVNYSYLEHDCPYSVNWTIVSQVTGVV